MSWNEPASNLSQYWPVLSDAAIKSAGLLSAAAIAACAMRRASAATRHWVWLLALCGALMLPVLSGALPQWKVLPAKSVLQSGPIFIPSPAVAIAPSVLPATSLDSIASPSPSTTVDWEAWSIIAWATGAAFFFAPVLLGMICLWRLGARAAPIDDADWNDLLDELSAKLNLFRPVRLLQSKQRSMPMTWGIWRAIILLPIEANAWSNQRRRLVLAHELAHVKRRDALTQLLAQLSRATYWFNPLAWLAVRRLAVERERACDDIVLNLGAKASDYAEELLAIATGYRPARMGGIAAIAMARASSLEGRMRAILDSCRNRNRSTRRIIWTASLALLITLLPLAALRSRAAAETGAGSDQQIADLIKTARQDIDSNDYTAALGVLDQILAVDPKNDYAIGVREFVEDRATIQGQRQSRENVAAAPATQPTLLQADQEAQAALDKILPETNFDGTSFADVIDYLRDTTGANIFVNKRVLEAAGVAPTTPITLKLHGVRVSKALDTVLDIAGGGTRLGYDLDQGVITISTAAQLDQNLTTIVYDVADLVHSANSSQPNQEMLDELVIMIKETVAPETWKDYGGKIGAISTLASHSQIVITQTSKNQQIVKSLLDQLRERDELSAGHQPPK